MAAGDLEAAEKKSTKQRRQLSGIGKRADVESQKLETISATTVNML